ncbi:MAG: S4 domain-containing protein [Bdellovibrionota bacterium]
MNGNFTYETQDNDVGKRLDAILFKIANSKEFKIAFNKVLSESDCKNIFSRSKFQELIKDGKILVNNKVAKKPSYILSAKDLISIKLSDIKQSSIEIKPWDFKIDIIFEDDDVLIVNKPKELVVHPGAGNRDRTLLNALIDKLSFDNKGKIGNNDYREGIVHRIDKDTTGLLVVAKK